VKQQCWSPAPLALLACALWPMYAQAQHAETTTNQVTNAANLAVSIEGQVSVKRKGWTGYAPVVFGSSLHIGDLLHVENSSRAQVLCSDLTLHDLPQGIGGVPCPSSPMVLEWRDKSMINSTRGGLSDGSFPTVLSPRRTMLLSPHPALRWTPVSGASAYEVIVQGPGLRWHSVVGKEIIETVYPERAPKLSPSTGYKYKLTIQTSGASSAEDPGKGLGFAILGPKETKAVEKQRLIIVRLGLPDGPTQFLIAYLYATHDLNAEAIQQLENVSQTFKAAAVARLLGDLYLNVGLPRQAEASYLNSLDLCKNEKDVEGEMLAHSALARIYEKAFANRDLASQHFNAALALAQKIGDDLTADQTKKRLAALKKIAM
jgi:hypothetical protein